MLRLPSVLSGKVLVFLMSDFIITPVLSSSAKLIPIILILTGAPRLILLRYHPRSGHIKYSGFM